MGKANPHDCASSLHADTISSGLKRHTEARQAVVESFQARCARLLSIGAVGIGSYEAQSTVHHRMSCIRRYTAQSLEHTCTLSHRKTSSASASFDAGLEARMGTREDARWRSFKSCTQHPVYSAGRLVITVLQASNDTSSPCQQHVFHASCEDYPSCLETGKSNSW